MPELKLNLTAGTNVGLVRSNNEDNFVVCRNLIKDDWTIPQAGETTDLGPYGALLVVADGMGGANAGEVASSLAIETVQKSFGNKRLSDVIKSEEKIIKFLCSIMHDADNVIGKHSKKNKETRGMGTTLVIAWLLNDKAYICWCGDSRCYVFNQAVGLTRLSKDHSLVQLLIDKGELTPENAHNHPMSNVITQCLGTATSKIDPGTRVYPLAHNDVLLLCTDGLCGLCTDDEIVKVMADSEDVVDMKGRLIEEALNAGGHDNVTVVICKIDGPSLVKTEEKEADINATHRSDLPMPASGSPKPESEVRSEESDTASEQEVSEDTSKPEPDNEVSGSSDSSKPLDTPVSSDTLKPTAVKEGKTDALNSDPLSKRPKRRGGKVGVLIVLSIVVIAIMAIAFIYRSEIWQFLLEFYEKYGIKAVEKLVTLLQRN